MISISIIVITSIISFLALNSETTFGKMTLMPREMNNKEYFRLISSGFIHGDYRHLIFNMLTLYFFGSILEKSILGPFEFLIFYLSAMLLGNLIAFQKYRNSSDYQACGASGAVAAVMFAIVLYEPWSKIYLHFFIPIYYILFAVGYLVYSYYMDKRVSDSRIAHDIHFYGSLAGLSYMLIFHPNCLSVFIQKLQNHPF